MSSGVQAYIRETQALGLRLLVLGSALKIQNSVVAAILYFKG